ncbi:MAG: DinB family protein [Mucilaginibacter sp.]
MSDEHKILVRELIKLLNGGNAHAHLDDALKGLPAELRGVKPEKLPYSIWQLLEHIRIAQWDMLKFSADEKHDSPAWPEGYWVKETAPKDEEEWNKSIQQINDDREEFIALLGNADIYSAIPHGDGQSILREALQIADHNAYHIAEIVLVRRLLGAWG